MTREQAVKKLRSLYGKQAMWAVGPVATSKEQRARAKERLNMLEAESDAIHAELNARLMAIEWYRDAQDRLAEIRRCRRGHESEVHQYKFQIGRNLGYAFHVTASGDTWEECFAKVEGKQ